MKIIEILQKYYLEIVVIVIIILYYVITRLKQRKQRTVALVENMNGNNETENLRLLAKYLTLIIRKNEAEKELYTIETGKRQVFNSPTLVQLNKQITLFKERIRENPSALKYFEENLNIML